MLKRLGLILLVCALPLYVFAEGEEGAAAGPQKYQVVKVIDRAGKQTYELMTPADLKNLQKQIADEGKFSTKAMSAAEKAWKEGGEKKPFPRSCIGQRKTQVMKEFTDQNKASDELKKFEDQEADKAKSEADKQTAREKAAIEKKTKTQAQIDKIKSKDNERQANDDSARSIYEEKLAELMAGAGGEAAAGEAAKPAEAAKEEKPAAKK